MYGKIEGSLLTVIHNKKSTFWLSNLFWGLHYLYKVGKVCLISFCVAHPNLTLSQWTSENWVCWDSAEMSLTIDTILPWVKSSPLFCRTLIKNLLGKLHNWFCSTTDFSSSLTLPTIWGKIKWVVEFPLYWCQWCWRLWLGVWGANRKGGFKAIC